MNLTLINQAVDELELGNVIAFATETVFGLGADALNPQACKKLYTLKNRSHDKPLSILIHSVDQLSRYAIDIPDLAYQLARQFWPGPLTLILNKSPIIPNMVSAGKNTIGLRIPQSKTLRNSQTTLRTLLRTGPPLSAPTSHGDTCASCAAVATHSGHSAIACRGSAACFSCS